MTPGHHVLQVIIALICYFSGVVYAAQLEVVVGGPGVLQFNPPTVVRDKSV